jgi:tetrapyrrole methylase family protein/MazG family protein
LVSGFEFKSVYGIDDLLNIMKILRSPCGCPWDREQTHSSIKSSLIEETYEVIEAINKNDNELLCEELGDVLLQVVFHSQMAKEGNAFAFEDVVDGVCKKLVERHPHVFGEVEAATSEQVLKNWEDIKNKSKNRSSATESMLSVPRELPALMRAQKIQKKAKKVGFDWESVDGALDKLEEETAELKKAIKDGDSDSCSEELGDLLFSAVNVSRFIGCDAEEALTAANDKFLSRFSKVEELANARGIDMKNSSLEELDKLWDEVKQGSF